MTTTTKVQQARSVAHRAVTEGVNLKYVEILRQELYSLADYCEQLERDTLVKTEALRRITKLTGYWAQVGQVAQRVAHEALGTSPIVAAPKEPYQTGEGMTDVEFYGR